MGLDCLIKCPVVEGIEVVGILKGRKIFACVEHHTSSFGNDAEVDAYCELHLLSRLTATFVDHRSWMYHRDNGRKRESESIDISLDLQVGFQEARCFAATCIECQGFEVK